MLKMGRMCHCGATLYRVNPITGQILWKVSREGESQLVASSTRVVTLGPTPEGQEDGRVMSRLDMGTSAPVEWFASKGSFTGIGYGVGHVTGNREAIVFNSAESVIWAVGTTGLASWDASTGEQIGEYLASDGPRHNVFSGPIGSVSVVDGNTLFVGTTGGPKRFDTSCAKTEQSSIDTGLSRDMCLFGGSLIALHGPDQGLVTPHIHVFDSDLNRTEFYPTGPFPDDRPGGNMTALCVQPYTGGIAYLSERRFTPFRRWLSGLTVGPLTETWVVEVTTEVQLGGKTPAFTVDGNDIFLREGLTEVVCRSTSDGSEKWRVNPGLSSGLSGIQEIKVGSDFVVVCGVRGGSPLRSAVCLERSSGHVRWATLHSDNDISVAVTADDRIYIVGGLGSVAEVDLP